MAKRKSLFLFLLRTQNILTTSAKLHFLLKIALEMTEIKII